MFASLGFSGFVALVSSQSSRATIAQKKKQNKEPGWCVMILECVDGIIWQIKTKSRVFKEEAPHTSNPRLTASKKKKHKKTITFSLKKGKASCQTFLPKKKFQKNCKE